MPEELLAQYPAIKVVIFDRFTPYADLGLKDSALSEKEIPSRFLFILGSCIILISVILVAGLLGSTDNQLMTVFAQFMGGLGLLVGIFIVAASLAD